MENNGLSPFCRSQLEAAGLGAVAERTTSGEALSLDDARKLRGASFPLLASLVEAAPSRVPVARIRPLLFLPLNALLASGRRNEDVIAFVDAELEKLTGTLASGTPVALVIDDWSANRLYMKILPLLHEIIRGARRPLTVLGPSTAELKAVAQSEAGDQSADFFTAAFFSELESAGITSIEGGTDVRLHRLAAESGLRVTFTHNLVRSRAKGVGEEFLRDLYELRAELLPTGNFETWSPWSSFVLDSGLPKADSPLGLEILEAVVLARLLLPEVPFIRAPLSLLGIHASEAAASLGANDLGYAAVQLDSAEKLGLFPLSYVLAELQAPHDLRGDIEPIIERSVESAAL